MIASPQIEGNPDQGPDCLLSAGRDPRPASPAVSLRIFVSWIVLTLCLVAAASPAWGSAFFGAGPTFNDILILNICGFPRARA